MTKVAGLEIEGATGKVQIHDAGVTTSGGTKLIANAQGAAVADATDAASAITQLNALLARVRASTGHGLIA